VGCVGAFSALLTLSREHFEQTPDELELSVFDLEYQGRTAAYLAPFVASYMAFPRDPQRFAAMADAVNAADLDVLYVVAHGGEALRLVDQAETACIVNACTGSDLLHHPKVDVQLYPQPQADYFARDGRVFCGTSRSCFGPERVAPAFFLYDGRGLDPARRAPWREREPLILFHGTLYKAVSPVYLDAIFGLLERDPELQFVLMGRDQGGQREAIERSARNRGLQQRVRYEGAFSGLRGPDGAIDDPAWSTLEDLLRRARLAPDPWPMGGAAARVEAYGAGVPSAHLRVRFEPEAWGRPQDALVEVEALLVPEGSAWTVHEYSELCDRCLHDEAFADSLAAEQARVFRQVTDAPAYWRQLVGAYDDWRG
jgi:hypothetical protein